MGVEVVSLNCAYLRFWLRTAREGNVGGHAPRVRSCRWRAAAAAATRRAEILTASVAWCETAVEVGDVVVEHTSKLR
jgi:hypothetical protein